MFLQQLTALTATEAASSNTATAAQLRNSCLRYEIVVPFQQTVYCIVYNPNCSTYGKERVTNVYILYKVSASDSTCVTKVCRYVATMLIYVYATIVFDLPVFGSIIIM